MNYDMYVIYENLEDDNLVEAGTEGNNEEEMINDIKYFKEKKDYFCDKCKKNHKLKLRGITINFS